MGTLNADPAGAAGAPGWSHAAVSRLMELARDGASAEAISLKLSRPASEIRSKASELGLPLKLDG